jgi:hypothetical protein
LILKWIKDRIEENKFINAIRERVALWRRGGYTGITKTTARLLEYWANPERDNKLFFCQIEALESIIYIIEVAKKYGDAWIENDLRTANENANPGLMSMTRQPARFATAALMILPAGSSTTIIMERASLSATHILPAGTSRMKNFSVH